MRRQKKNLLFLTSHLPYPPVSGGRLREYELIKRISCFYNVFLVAITKTYEQDQVNQCHLENICKKIVVFPCFEHDTEYNSFNPEFNQTFLELKNIYCSKVLRIISPKADVYLKELLEKNNIDIIHLEGFYMHFYFPNKMQIPIVLAEQNIEFDILSQEMKLGDPVGSDLGSDLKSDLEREYELTKNHEINAWNAVDCCVVLTSHDLQLMRQYVGVNKTHLISNGFDHLSREVALISQPKDKEAKSNDKILLLTGNFQYKPNHDAVFYFINELFPTILNTMPEVQLWIVGNQPGPEMMKLENTSIKIFPNVPSMEPFLKQASVFVCPLRLGGGIKVKMLEALSYQLPIVTTPIGAQGLPTIDPPGFLIGHSNQEFIEMVIDLLENEETRKFLSKSSQKVLEHLPSWQDSVQALVDLYDSLCISQTLKIQETNA